MNFYRDKSLEIFPEVPHDGIEVSHMGHTKNYNKLRENPELLHNPFYFCRACSGYIQGKPAPITEDTMRPLAGRQGCSYRCRRCGRELCFVGAIS